MRKRKKHVQITLVGGQPTPVYQGITQLNPDQVVLVCSEGSQKVANVIKEQLPSYDSKDIVIKVLSDSDLEEITQKVEEIESQIPKGITVSLNVSSGLKVWTVVFDRVLKRRRRNCHTFCIGQNGVIFDFKENHSLRTVNFDMDAQFKLLGNPIDNYTPFSSYSEADFAVMEQMKEWFMNPEMHKVIFKLTQIFVEGYKKTFNNNDYTEPFQSWYEDSELYWDPERQTFTLIHGPEEQILRSPLVANVVLNTGWFELYVATYIASKYHPKDIRMNCIFKNRRRNVKNEVDIIVNTGDRLIFVECKTQVYNSVDVDKFHSVVKNYGGLGSKHLFVTFRRMQPDALEKCKDYGITTFYLENANYECEQDRVDAFTGVLEKLNKSWNFK